MKKTKARRQTISQTLLKPIRKRGRPAKNPAKRAAKLMRKPTPLVIATSSSALFDLTKSDKVYRTTPKKYKEYQRKKENVPLKQGKAFKLIKKFLDINAKLAQKHKLGKEEKIIEVILLSRNSGDTGLRVFNSIRHHKLDITRAAFCSGSSPALYGKAFNSQLFLSENKKDVTDFIKQGLGASVIYAPRDTDKRSNELRIAFDGDGVIFDDSSELINQREGIDAFRKNEQKKAKTSLPDGPFRAFLEALHYIQENYVDKSDPKSFQIVTGLFTARSAPAHARVIRTLRRWDINLDHCVFLGGQAKGKFLDDFQADIFFDDKRENIDSSTKHKTPAGHVPQLKSKPPHKK